MPCAYPFSAYFADKVLGPFEAMGIGSFTSPLCCLQYCDIPLPPWEFISSAKSESPAPITMQLFCFMDQLTPKARWAKSAHRLRSRQGAHQLQARKSAHAARTNPGERRPASASN